jgi:hypothetical protein
VFFSSPLSLEAKCMALLPAMLERRFVRHSVEWRCKSENVLPAGLSLTTFYLQVIVVLANTFVILFYRKNNEFIHD